MVNKAYGEMREKEREGEEEKKEGMEMRRRVEMCEKKGKRKDQKSAVKQGKEKGEAEARCRERGSALSFSSLLASGLGGPLRIMCTARLKRSSTLIAPSRTWRK